MIWFAGLLQAVQLPDGAAAAGLLVRPSIGGVSEYHQDVGPEGGERQPEMVPWPQPHGGYERILKPDRRAARRRPLRAWEVTFHRVCLLLFTAVAIAGLAAGPRVLPLWCAAMGAVSAELGWLIGWLVVPAGRHWLQQIAGLRPPARRDS